MANTDAKASPAPAIKLVVVHPFFYPGSQTAYKHGDEITDAAVIGTITAKGSHLARNCVRVAARTAAPAAAAVPAAA